MPSAADAMWTPASSWLTIFTVLHDPQIHTNPQMNIRRNFAAQGSSFLFSLLHNTMSYDPQISPWVFIRDLTKERNNTPLILVEGK